jgi:hypothetical protein
MQNPADPLEDQQTTNAIAKNHSPMQQPPHIISQNALP